MDNIREGFEPIIDLPNHRRVDADQTGSLALKRRLCSPIGVAGYCRSLPGLHGRRHV